MDISQALKDTENVLRDFISFVMKAKYGQDWFGNAGISEDKIQRWKQRKEEDQKRLAAADERLLYYADFYDIKKLISDNWGTVPEFSAALGKKKEVLFWLERLEGFRNPEAHRRDLLPHQKHLVLGIEGEIRMKLIRYRNKQESREDYYPRIEFARDSLGNGYIPEYVGCVFNTNTKLRPGDKLDFSVTATDPSGETLLFALKKRSSKPPEWQKENNFSIEIEASDIGRRFIVQIIVKSQRDYHQYGDYDDDARFEYEVLPLAL
ncbi:Swt1 family HEPN domain-containing protein [Franzmannia qiaohouensis]|uniref:Swt1 family HEPN domain-containing protein n=1 Tax=Franzmannia qiaohouensis TaxID=1329370 RepID=A0ABU1HJE7_9GAMM|nr:Swt1 family HEPN domain-containing protein [Halomonas qiaohouensis]MDR5907596.1 Swt1 family HEPN domain-containing protein [Halomonas qiaohouensis]